jgi:hypothetical protein
MDLFAVVAIVAFSNSTRVVAEISIEKFQHTPDL